MAGGDRENADSALVAALASGATRQQAAERAGVSEATVYRRLSDPSFRLQLDNARAEHIERTIGALAAASTAAVATLLKLLNAKSETARLGAARSILEFSAKFQDSEEMKRRLEAVETVLKVRKAG